MFWMFYFLIAVAVWVIFGIRIKEKSRTINNFIGMTVISMFWPFFLGCFVFVCALWTIDELVKK